MNFLSFITLLLVSTYTVYASPQKQNLTANDVTQKLVKIAAAIQNYESQLSSVEYNLNLARIEESSILQELSQYNQQLMETIHYLRHAKEYSPLLAILSASKPEDVIHSSILLRSLTPAIHARNQQLFAKLKSLSQIRAQLEAKQEELRALTFKYYEERDALDTLQSGRSQPSAVIADALQDDTEKLILKNPVVGKIIPTYQSTNPDWASYTQGILFTTRPEAQVVSPIAGNIVFAGDYAHGQGKMISIKSSKSLVMMSGMESLNHNCIAGQNIVVGEPIGRMPKLKSKKRNPSAQISPRLYLEVWNHEQTVDPQAILQNEQRAE